MLSECSSFIDSKMKAINPKSIENPSSERDRWDNNAALACFDKFLFRKKMLYACNVSDLTIADLEGRLEQYRMDDVLAEPPSELRFTKPTEKCPRIPINKLRSMKTINPLTTVDLDAVNPKVAIKEDRMWYPILPRSSTEGGEYHQDDPSNMFMCSKCSKDKVAGTEYDQIKEKEISKYWGSLQPADNIRAWTFETIKVFRNHHTGIGKYVSHVGTTRMNLKGAANAMNQGKGKQISVERPQVFGTDGNVIDYYHFTFDHGNSVYSDYMKLLLNTGDLKSITGSGDPKEELLEICLGILRVALMYEGCVVDLFGCGSICEILTGLEHSLLVFNASAYPSGLRNRKIGASKKVLFIS